ncbi:TPA: type IV secretory system conjugative DNA transfer family protein [Clostridioides difficile]|nr:type IV secretory system conjugative DNA transfer family protein [Clostridioides difficile]TGA44278.1 type IV secretory system conjugative DNA transfer family protein [Clostridioides difficile]HBF1102414.1 type IV secretory system conjugative DNA transfer family protein [Clostridioides difficile]HBF1291715.1 type IV secretory system conjugative DNA transfer family protein [Clostridioides difficile]HBF3642624.1 type IV secretory system conjugative DNA transfer family protein [Clostridioides d
MSTFYICKLNEISRCNSYNLLIIKIIERSIKLEIIKDLINSFFETRNAEFKFAKKLVNKEYLIKIGLFIFIIITIFLNTVLESISSLTQILNGGEFNLWRIFIPRLLTCFPVYVVVYCIFLVAYLKVIANIKTSYAEFEEGQKGTVRFATNQEIHEQYKAVPEKDELYEGKGGIPISRNPETKEIYVDDSSVNNLIIGTTRSGKGETYVVPTIDIFSRAKEKPSLVINDPKGELIAMCGDTLKDRGYEVLMLNLLDPLNSSSYNPLQLVLESYKGGRIDEAQLICKTLTYTLYHNPNSKDPIWENSASALVNAMILAICDECIEKGEEHKITMYTVANMLSTLGSQNRKDYQGNNINALDEYFKKLPNNSAAKLQYATSRFAEGNTRASIFTTAMSELQLFTMDKMAKLTSKNTIDLKGVGFKNPLAKEHKPKAIFMVTPDYDSSNHKIASLFIRQLYYVLAKNASLSKNGKCEIGVEFILDEFGNMPPIESFANIITVCLGRNIRFSLIVQAYSQLEKIYGKDMNTIVANCGNQIYLLTNDDTTAEKFSKLVGEKTVITRSRSGKVLSLSKSQTENLDTRRLLKADELTKLQEGETVVVRVIKRRDLKGRKIISYPIYNRVGDERAFRYRYEYLNDDFGNKKSFCDIQVNTVHKDVNLEELSLFHEKTKEEVKREIEERIESIMKTKINPLSYENEKIDTENQKISEYQKNIILKIGNKILSCDDIKELEKLSSKEDIFDYLKDIGREDFIETIKKVLD